jgi:hypothetical protein
MNQGWSVLLGCSIHPSCSRSRRPSSRRLSSFVGLNSKLSPILFAPEASREHSLINVSQTYGCRRSAQHYLRQMSEPKTSLDAGCTNLPSSEYAGLRPGQTRADYWKQGPVCELPPVPRSAYPADQWVYLHARVLPELARTKLRHWK